MAAIPTWAEMLGRVMAVSFDTAIGTMEWSDPDEEAPADRGVVRFWHAQPDRWRIEDEDGPFVITGPGGSYVRSAPGVMARLRAETHIGLAHDPRELLDGRGVAASLSERNDFSRPLGPGQQTEIGGRIGWRFVLAPPPHKPAPLEVVFDAETGVVLEYRSQGAAYWETLTSFDSDVEVDDELFLWRGEVDTTWIAEGEAHERRFRALAAHPWPSPRWWPTGLGLDVIDGDVDQGWFIGALGHDRERVIARWRPGTEPPRLEAFVAHLSFRHRWDEDGWVWLLATDEVITPEDLQRIIASIPPG